MVQKSEKKGLKSEKQYKNLTSLAQNNNFAAS